MKRWSAEFDPPGLARRVRITLTDLNPSVAGSVTLRDPDH